MTTFSSQDVTPDMKKVASSNLTAFLMDVTSEKSVEEGYKLVSSSLKETQDLWAVVNNAGIAGLTAPVEWLHKSEFTKVMEVNFLGMVHVINTFLPLLKKSRGRIVNMSSGLGRFTFPGTGPYCASKHAVEGYSDVLRFELRPFDVSVHLIEPGFFATGFAEPNLVVKKTLIAYEAAPAHVKEAYGPQFLLQSQKLALELIPFLMSTNLDKVIVAYEHAVLGWFPRGRYLLGWDANWILWPLHLLPEWLSDTINELTHPIPKPITAVNRRW